MEYINSSVGLLLVESSYTWSNMKSIDIDISLLKSVEKEMCHDLYKYGLKMTLKV